MPVNQHERDNDISLPSPPKTDTVTILTQHRVSTADMRSCTSGSIRAFHFQRQRPNLGKEGIRIHTAIIALEVGPNTNSLLRQWLMIALEYLELANAFLACTISVRQGML